MNSLMLTKQQVVLNGSNASGGQERKLISASKGQWTKVKKVTDAEAKTKTNGTKPNQQSSNKTPKRKPADIGTEIVKKAKYEATTKVVFDQLMERVNSTNEASKIAHITQQAKDKHLNRADVDSVLREAAKPRLDTNLLKQFPVIDKYWIIATHFRKNPHMEVPKICQQFGLKQNTLDNFIDSELTCEKAMGLYPTAYKRLLEDFKANGNNTEVNFFFIPLFIYFHRLIFKNKLF